MSIHDEEALAAAMARHPAGKAIPQQPREHPVPCQRCRRRTWNHSAICDRHPGAAG